MDPKPIRRLPGLRSLCRGARRVQRQVHVQPDGVARGLVLDEPQPHSVVVPKLFSARCTLAVHRYSTREAPMTLTAAPLSAPPTSAFQADVEGGLSSQPKSLPCKYFYDEQGSELFARICELGVYYPTR